MSAVESPPVPLRGGQHWPLSVAAYRALGESGLIPENTELLHGFVLHENIQISFSQLPFAIFA
jgi:hypothetical protein